MNIIPSLILVIGHNGREENFEVNDMRKLIIILSILFVIFMITLFIYYLIKGDSSRWQVALGGVVVSAGPLFLLKLKENPFNISIILGYYVFIFLTIFLGSICGFYLRFKWWDSPIHGYKGLLLAFIGTCLFKRFIPEKDSKTISKWFHFLFVFSLSVALSVIWEIYEFIGDLTFTHTMQMGGNRDTMTDLICGTAGALIAGIYSAVRKSY